MRQAISLSLCAGLLMASCGAAAASDVSTWRWKVSQCLREQQERDAHAIKVYHEATAFEITSGRDLGGDARSGADPLYSGDLKAAAQIQSTGQ